MNHRGLKHREEGLNVIITKKREKKKKIKKKEAVHA